MKHLDYSLSRWVLIAACASLLAATSAATAKPPFLKPSFNAAAKAPKVKPHFNWAAKRPAAISPRFNHAASGKPAPLKPSFNGAARKPFVSKRPPVKGGGGGKTGAATLQPPKPRFRPGGI